MSEGSSITSGYEGTVTTVSYKDRLNERYQWGKIFQNGIFVRYLRYLDIIVDKCKIYM